MKRLWTALAALALLLIVFYGVSFAVARKWGHDVDTLDIKQGEFSFRARRDEVGVWHLSTSSLKDLWFAFGYVQALDREFQTELVHSMALGKLTTMVGASQLTRDRFMRLASRVSFQEYRDLSENSPVRTAAEAYVKGRKAYLAAPIGGRPVEFRVLGLERADFPDWQPWEVVAVTRAHTWEFSYDVMEEVRSVALEHYLGHPLATLLEPIEPVDSSSVYGQVSVKSGVKARLPSVRKIPEPRFFFPEGATPWQEKSARLNPQSPLEPLSAPSTFADAYTGAGLGAELGASNIWLTADDRKNPKLCNDTHLAFSWPSALYPVVYEVANDLEGQGFMLPGIPAMVIGRVDQKASILALKQFAWGITMAAFGDTQDLVAVGPETLKKSKILAEDYVIRDPKTGQRRTEHFQETWTSWGPRVDDIFRWSGAPLPGPVALDWLGYRAGPSPLGFFINRNIHGADGLRDELAGQWAYPAVNFTWMESEKVTRVGHAVTGLLFDRNRRSHPRGILSESEARGRKLSQPSQRPYFDEALSQLPPKFLLVAANQRIWPGALSSRVATEWLDGARADRIAAKGADISKRAESAQTDYFVPALKEFVHLQRERLGADRLCGQVSDENTSLCHDLVSGLDHWDGIAATSSWETSLAALWYSKTKVLLWPKGLPAKSSELSDLFNAWAKSNPGIRMMSELLKSEALRQRWASLNPGRSFDDISLESFQESVELLVKELGPLNERWEWGHLHRIQWQHPLALMPKPWGPMLQEGLLGVSPGVPGAVDSPGRFDFSWKFQDPLNFPATHGAVMRMCSQLGVQGSRSAWTAVAGVSGNPFSKWAWAFSEEYYFRDRLYPSGP